VHEYVLNQRLGWYGYVPGAKPSFYHSWYLEPRGAMCHVVMDEAGVGKDAAGLRKSDETLMRRGHDLWLATLKWVAEGAMTASALACASLRICCSCGAPRKLSA